MALFDKRFIVSFALIFLAAAGLKAAPIKIGQTADFSGPIAPGVREATAGAKAVFDSVNRSGGIDGREIELISLDDKFNPELAAQNAKELISQGVVSLFLTRGTPHTQAILPLLLEYKTPLVGPSTGAMTFHQPVHPWLFNVRATYQKEAERAVRHLSLVGVARIAIVQVDDSFGADAVRGALAGFEAVGKRPAVHVTFDRNKPDMRSAVDKIIAANTQAALFLANGAVIADAAQRLREAGSRVQIVTLSNNASSGFIKMLGAHSRGTIVSQVYPYERSIASGVVREARELAKANGAGDVSPSFLEGMIAAKVLVEGLRRAAPHIDRAGLRSSLEGIKRLDLGGIELSYGPNDHSGLDFADLSIIGETGKFER
ncbi:ABC transporter substrate-binding protein [Ideonella sp. DXS29W]|uniref:ABC transporter substrate-binding protein n=1 Tax=Ideonella lacteola TaxID=2984193 RepID=A0ABU9BTA5_9BURK